MKTRNFAAVDAVFEQHLADGAAPSATWAVFDLDGIVHTGAVGTLTDATTPGPDTAYRIASCTKSFTAAAVLSVRDQGVLQLDDPITRFIPSFESMRGRPTPDSPVPSIRMLLTMSAGFPTDDPWADRMESMSDDEFDELVRRGFSFDSIPGTQFAYSNLGYALLGRVVSKVSGTPYRDYIAELLLDPLGLTGTGFDSATPAPRGIAVGTRQLDGEWCALPFTGPGAFSPIGGLFSTARDLATWARLLCSAFDPHDTHRFAADHPGFPSRSTLREMQQLHRFAPALTAHPTGYGFGLFVEHYPELGPVVSHSGGYPGFSSHMRWSTEAGLGIVAFENATYARVAIPATQALDGLLGARPAAATAFRPLARELWPATRNAQAQVTRLIHSWADASEGNTPEPSASRRTAAEPIADAPDTSIDAVSPPPGDVVPADFFAVNVALDEPWDRRRAHAEQAAAEVGGLKPLPAQVMPPGVKHETSGGYIAEGEESVAPSHLVWRLAGESGTVRVEIQLNPQLSPRVQTLKIAAEPRG